MQHVRRRGAEGAPGRGRLALRHDHLAHAELAREDAGVRGPRAAEGEQHEIARIEAFLHRHLADHVGHLQLDDAADPGGAFHRIHIYFFTEVLNCLRGRGKVQLHLASGVQSKSGRADKIVLDRETLLDRVDGDMQLLGEITQLFLRECDPLMASAREAMKTGNAGRFAYDIHTLRGMFRSLSATAAQEAAGKLEELDLVKNLEKVQAAYALLEQEAQALKAELGGTIDKTVASSGVM